MPLNDVIIPQAFPNAEDMVKAMIEAKRAVFGEPVLIFKAESEPGLLPGGVIVCFRWAYGPCEDGQMGMRETWTVHDWAIQTHSGEAALTRGEYDILDRADACRRALARVGLS